MGIFQVENLFMYYLVLDVDIVNCNLFFKKTGFERVYLEMINLKSKSWLHQVYIVLMH